MPNVPTKSTLKDAATTGGMNGLASGVGRMAGRSVLGPGLGTAVGGVGAAAALDGTDRDMVATIAVDRAVDELFAGASSSGSSGGGRRRM